MRLTILAGMVVLVMLVLLGRMLYLQVVHHKHYETRARANQITPLPVPPVRGLILDRNGIVLAQNYPAYTLEVTPERVEDMAATLKQLSQLVKITERDLVRFNRMRKSRPGFEPQTLRTNLSDEEAARISIDRPHLQGVELRARLQRHYPLAVSAYISWVMLGALTRKRVGTSIAPATGAHYTLANSAWNKNTRKCCWAKSVWNE